MNMAARKDAITIAQSLIKRQPLYLDTETTGTGPNDNILEISIVDHDGKILMDTLVKPVGIISPEARAVHKISDEMVRGAPRWGAIWGNIETVLAGRLVGIYNADFDLRLMQQSHALNWLKWTQPPGMEVFCVMKLYAQFYGRWNPKRGNFKWQSLEAAGRQCGIDLPNTHRAKDDTLLARAILHYIAEQEF
jgi:DNA polymerase-3 subunit epsilon